MKKYTSLGQLLIDYRKINTISRADFAANIDVDIRTVQRWENNETLIKAEKEIVLVHETLLPYQLIRNLNSTIPISTCYDFRIRKYSLNELSRELPNASWFKERINIKTHRIRKINFDKDIDYIMRFMKFQKSSENIIHKQIIKEAIKLLPELNFIITDDSGYYAGHTIVLPLILESYKKLKKRVINENQLTVGDLVNYKTLAEPVFHEYDVSADCNDNIYFIVAAIFRFFKNFSNKNYIYSAYTTRHDSIEVTKILGLKVIWEDLEEQNKLGLDIPPRFESGNFNKFLSE